MWLTIYIIPFLKYPANPPTVGDTDTIVMRSVLYLSLIAISGLGALGFYQLSKKFSKQKKWLAIVGYAAFITGVFFAMPENPDPITAPIELVNEFRIMSVVGVTIFWISLGIILGLFWEKFQPHSSLRKEPEYRTY